MSVSITIDGFDKFLTVTDPARAAREIDQAVQRSAQMLRDEVKKMPPVNKERTGFGQPGIPVAPRQGGTLRQSIASRKVALMAADVYVGAAASAYGHHVHDGTSRMPSRPFFRWQLEEFGGLDKIEIILTATLERLASP